MDDELVKRNTDCVYFLASPFTCKKGAECEYRHSEMARLNPRDCWFWLSGNCLNPTCAFRHPPMDVHAETSAQAQAEPLPNNSSLPTSKSNVPCYFYLNTYCSKGDKCSFLHSSEDASAVKPKIDSASTGAPSLDNKITSKASVPKISAEPLDAKVPSIKLDTKMRSRMTDNKVSIITEPVPDQPEKGTGLLEVALETDNKVPLHGKKWIQSSDTYNIIERKTSRHSIASEFEETNVSKSPSLNPPENIVKSDPSIYSDQSSEDQVDKDVVRDEWWESSPGFDVLVEGKSEGMTYGDEEEYMRGYNDGYDGNDEDHGNPFLEHRYEDRNDSGDRFLRENRIHEPAYYSDDDERHNLNGYSDGDRRTNHSMPQKRKFLAIGLPVRGHYSGDLREHLSKRRFHAEGDVFRHCNFPLHTEEIRGEPQQSSVQRLHGRLASKLERNGVSLTAERSAFVTPIQRGRPRNSQLTTKHHHHERKRLPLSSRIQRRPFPRQKRDNNNDIAFSGPRQKRDSNNDVSFSGPKTLAQIKEGKDRMREDATSSREARDSGQNSSVNFDGPKRFTEILKEKKRGGSGQEEDINVSS